MAKLVAMAGLPASGKSTIAQELAARLRAVWLRIDSMDQAIWASGDAPRDLRDWTYRAAQAVAADNLALGHDVIADCVNDCRAARDGWRVAALQSGAEVVWIEVVCTDPAEHRRRVETRKSDVPGLSLPSWQTVVTRAYDPWEWSRVVIDTAHRPLGDCVTAALSAVQARTA